MRKKILLLMFLSYMVSSKATTYYFSSRGNDSNNGTSESTPFQTLNKLNSLLFGVKAGDVILFKRGDVFTGSIIATNLSGSSSNPITFGAYGTGKDPVISGFSTITEWKNTDKGLYSASVPTNLSSCNVVTMDNMFQRMGKMPKGNSGYYTVGPGSTTSIINSKEISKLPSYAGGEIVWRPYEFTLWRGTINTQTSNTISFTAFPSTSGGNTEPPQSGFGFFFQNSPAACTRTGEWAYDPKLKLLTMYFGSVDPKKYTVKAVTTDILINVSGSSNIKLTNLSLEGSNTYVITGTNATNVTIDNCKIFGGGVYGIFGNGASHNWSITNSKISYCNSIGIRASGQSNAWTITGNTLDEIGNVAGMGGSGEGEYFGMRDIGANSTISYNKVTNIGYAGINIRGNNVLVQYNFLDSSCTIKQDGAGIYFGGDFNSGSKILNNIVLHCLGNKSGTTSSDLRGYGIYADDGTADLEIAFNTCAYNGNAGFYNHNGHNMNIHDNTFYYNGVSSVKYYNDQNTIAKITYTNNINFARSGENVFKSSGGTKDPKTFFVAADNNYYSSPGDENNSFQTHVPNSNSYSLSSWQKHMGQEKNSKHIKGTTKRVRFEYNPTKNPKKIPLDAKYVDLKGITTSELTLQPYSSAILIHQAP